MYLDRLIIKRFGNIESLTLKFKKGLNVIDCSNKREVAFAYCLAVGGGNFGDEAKQFFKEDTEITASFSDGDGKVNVIITRNDKTVITNGDNAERYKKVFSENSRRNTSCYFFPENGKIQSFKSGLAEYKDDEYCLSDEYIKRFGIKEFRVLLNLYIRINMAKPLAVSNGVSFSIKSDGKFTGFSANPKTPINKQTEDLFDYYCFLAVRKFWQEIHRTKDINYPEIPLLIADFNGNINGEKKVFLVKAALKNSEQVLAI